MTRAGRLRLQVLDPAGRTVRTLHDGWGAAGDGHARWDGRDDGGREVPSGVYVLRITAEAPELPLATATRRLVVLR
jgi:flagellar hook assembly protein FlgD